MLEKPRSPRHVHSRPVPPLLLAAQIQAPAPPLAEAARKLPGFTSLLVLRQGRTVTECYADGGDATTLRDTRSTTKTVTAFAVGAAIADGKLPSAQAPLYRHLAGWAPFEADGPLKRGITFRDALTMSSALACDDEDEQSPGNEEAMYPRKAWVRWAADLPVKDGWRRDPAGYGPWAYCTAGTVLLGAAVGEAAGTPVDRYVEDRILRPLGIRTWQWHRSPSGEPMTGGGLRLTTRDLARLAQLLLDRGEANGRQVLPASWVDAMLTVHRQAYGGEFGYGYLIWRRVLPGAGEAWLMAGTGGSCVLALPSRGAVAVLTREHFKPEALKQTLRWLEQDLAPALAN